ncbi:M1 family metallopeptidase [Actinocorallia lasiicapitis]
MKRIASVAAASLVAALAFSPAAQAKIVYSPGADNAGDSYYGPEGMGNGGYDVSGYDITLKYDPATRAIQATTKVNAVATQNLSSFNFDFHGPLTVDAIVVGSNPATFTRTGDQELVVTPKYGISAGATFSATVTYHGVPQRIDDDALGISGWIATPDGAVALNQPIGAATFFPVNDTPLDKATYSYTITTPSNLTAIANGEQGEKVTADGLTTVKWKMKQPMSSELAMVAIGKYDVTTGRTDAGIRSITAIDSTLVNSPTLSKTFFDQSNDVTDWVAKTWGAPWPFASTGGIVDPRSVGYALETQGRPYYEVRGPGRLPSGTLLAHELGHQYFGDSVTPKQWKDIWLNEGYASYTEWLYTEAQGGQSADDSFDDTYGQPASAHVWALPMADPGRDNIFDEVVYDKGAMTLHALRKQIGDQAFFDLSRTWVTKYKYSNASTEDYVALAQQISGQDLTAFFAKWAYNPGKPSL